MNSVSTCLWFNDEALEAAEFYCGIFPNSYILDAQRYLEGAPKPAGSVLTVRFTLDGTEFMTINGSPEYPFTPAISLVANCHTQQELDRLWQALGDGGKPGQCGWLTDRYGVSWQIVPQQLLRFIASDDKAAAQRAFNALMGMSKLDIEALQRAFDGT